MNPKDNIQLLFIIFLACLIPESYATVTYQAKAETATSLAKQTAYNVSKLLDSLLKDYDNSLRPDFGGPPALIEANMQVRSMGPISEMDMSYSMDCYFRQSWVDKRLAFSGYKDALALSIEMLRKIWKPDTFVYNGKRSYLHTITTQNRFVRLFPNGRVLYSQRLTIRATCLMNLEAFPMDRQRCPLKIGSFAYTSSDLTYQWTAGRGVNIASDMKLSQFDLISTPTGNETMTINHGDHSTLLVSFHLQRHMGDFVIQVYGPCILLVVISWVSFWLNREATSDRISLGITTVLTMTFMGLEARKDLPKVTYPTALDYFVFISFMYIFSTVVQFGLVHHFTKLGSGEYYLEELENEVCPKYEREKRERQRQQKRRRSSVSLFRAINAVSIPSHHISDSYLPAMCSETSLYTMDTLRMVDMDISPQHNIWQDGISNKFLNHHPNSTRQRKTNGVNTSGKHSPTEDEDVCRCKRCITRAMNDPDEPLNSVSKIDRISRVVFPVSFFIINIFYWNIYLGAEETTDLSRET